MPGSKKRKVASDLPDPLELLAKSKAAKRSVKTAFDALLSAPVRERIVAKVE